MKRFASSRRTNTSSSTPEREVGREGVIDYGVDDHGRELL
jgi:hypothetical protein